MPLTRARKNVKPSTSSLSVHVDESPSSSATMTLEAESWIERTDHPLMNNVVLTILFEYLELKELQSSRLVCRKWNELTLPFCRAKFLVNIMTPQRYFTKEMREGLVRFIKLMKSNTLGNPYAHYRLWAFDPRSPIGQQFIKLCGKTAKGYILHDNTHKIEDVSELLKLSPMLESLTLPSDMKSKKGNGTVRRPRIVKLFPGPEDTKPKLTFLKFLSATDELGITRPYICPSLYEELIGVAENITTLDLWTYEWYGENNIPCDDVLAAIEKFGRESSIESLKLPPFGEDRLEILRRMVTKPNWLKLKHLDFQVHETWEEPFLNEVMSLFKDSLISLKILYPPYKGCGQTIRFPPMPKLKRLEMFTKDPVSTFENFRQTFPVLEELKFCSSRGPNRFKDFINLEGEDSSVVRSLFLATETEPLKMKVFNRILTLFPILAKLECQILGLVGAEILRKIWTHMTQLETLKISGRLRRTLDLDSLVTGIPVKVIKQMKLSKYTIFDSLGQLDMEARRTKILMLINEHRTLPSIGNLTNLRTLTLDLTTVTEITEGLCMPQRVDFLSDISGYLGLYSLRNLQNLCVLNCGFTTPCAETLVKDNCLLSWKFASHRRGDEILRSRLSRYIATVWGQHFCFSYY